ncbi:MAG: hypothetical protein AAF203_08750, partial [Pseudomonadota bacterium]
SSEILRKRLDYTQIDNWVDNSAIESLQFSDFLRNNRCDVLVNHGWKSQGYKTAISNIDQELETLLSTWDHLFSVIQTRNKNMRVIHTGTVYEAGEGGCHSSITDYGKLKSLFWSEFKELAKKYKIVVNKVVLPNPIGPLESPSKLVSSFWAHWAAGKKPTLKTPHWVRDNISLHKMLLAYEEALVATDGTVLRPSEFVCSNRELANTLSKLAQQNNFKEYRFHESVIDDEKEEWHRRTNSRDSNCEGLMTYLSKWLLKESVG